jgi:predicted ATPase
MADTYAELGYELTELPRAIVRQRADFLIAAIGSTLPRGG